jgi:hypothetical protein
VCHDDGLAGNFQFASRKASLGDPSVHAKLRPEMW